MKQDLVKSSVQRDNDGVARISSRDVAEIFDKEHFHVLRDIKNLECSEEFKSSNFGFVEIIEKTAGGAKYNKSYCTMTRDGFTFLAMGFSGKRAAEFKELLIKRFNELEAIALSSAPQLPKTYIEALKALVTSEEQKQILYEENTQLRSTVKEQTPKAEAYDAFLNTDGLYSLTEAGKIVYSKPNKFTEILRKKKILYHRNGVNLPMQKYADIGYFEVKAIKHSSGSYSQTFVTTRGIGWLKRKVNDEVQLAIAIRI